MASSSKSRLRGRCQSFHERLRRRFPRQRRATACSRTRVGGDVSPVGLPTSPAIQRPGLTGTSHRRTDEHTDRAAREGPCPPSAADGRPTLSRTRSPSSSEQRRPSYACRGRLGRHVRQPQPPSTVVAGTIRRGFRQTPAVGSSKTLAPPSRRGFRQTPAVGSSKTLAPPSGGGHRLPGGGHRLRVDSGKLQQ